MSDPPRRRSLVLGALAVAGVLLIGLLAAALYVGSSRYVLVPGSDMHGEARALVDCLDDTLPPGGSVSFGLRGGFDPGPRVNLVGVVREQDQDGVLERLRARRRESAFRYPVFVVFHERAESETRETPEVNVTRSWKVGLLREERLD